MYMKRLNCRILTLLYLLSVSFFIFAQSDRRPVNSSPITENYKNSVRRGFYNQLNSKIQSGYHGFADLGYTIGIADYTFNRFELSSTHGYQFNPYIFLGGGLGLHIMSKYKTPNMDIPLDSRDFMIDMPIYAETRITFIDGSISPFIAARGGYYLTHSGGLYINASVGCRFAIGINHAINVFLGYSSENLEFDTFKRFNSTSSMDYSTEKRKLSTEGISIRVGYEF